MTRYLLARALGGAVVIVGLVVFSFLATHYIGDPVSLMVDSELSQDAEADRQALLEAGGFNRPVWEQFYDYCIRVVQGDFGMSLWQNRPAADVVVERIPATLQLGAASVLVTFAVAIPAALVAARYDGRWPDAVISTVSTALASVAPFWLGMGLIFLLAVQLGLVPTSGYGSWRHAVLPVLTISAQPIGHVTQVLRANLASEMRQGYVATARAKGLAERTVLSRHVLRNSAIVAVTALGGLSATLMNGAVLVETIFAWPGIGQVGLQAVERRDLPVLIASVFYIGVVVTVINLLVDVAYVYLDPRVRLR